MAPLRGLLRLLAAAGLALGALAEEKETASPVESSISVMLLGSIGFQMLLFYLVHWPDTDIRRYSWSVISRTISIFCAVLLFQGFNGLMEAYIIEGGGETWEVLVDMVQLVWWLTALQVVLAITSGAVNEWWGGTSPAMETVELNVGSLATLFSHVAGFSAINAWGSLQQSIFRGSPFLTLMVVPIGYVGLYVMFQGYDMIRDYIAYSDDGQVDEYEEKWDDETEESENDVAGLSLSFLTVQAIRYAISGVLPNQEGTEGSETESSHTAAQWQMLIGTGFIFGISGIIVMNITNCIKEPSKRWERITKILNNYLNFGNAWCLFYGVKWAFFSTKFTTEVALLHVVIALSLSAGAFLLIFALDKVMDYDLLGETSELTDNAVETIIGGLGILVGFSWEQCFDTAVGVVAGSIEEKCPEAISKLVMSIILVVIVFPAWRIYILPTERELLDATTVEGQRKSVLKSVASQHYALLLDKETDEHTLDLAHLKMKQHRRKAHGLPHPAQAAGLHSLKHLQVTCKGIVEADVPGEHGDEEKPKKLLHQKTEVVKLFG